MSYNKCERVIDKIDKSFKEYGKNRIFLMGNNLNDIFLRNLKDGCYSLIENLKFYVKDSDKLNWFIYIKENKKVEYYEKKADKLILKKREDFIKQKIDKQANKFLNKAKSNKTENNSEINNAVDESMENLENEEYSRILIEIIDKNMHTDKEVLVYVENLDWSAQFYENETDSKFINAIKNLEKLRKHLVVVSLKQVETLKNKYYEEYDDKELITIGKPNMQEIEIMLHRISWMKYGYSLKNLDYEGLASQFSKSDNNLRECSRIFKEKLEKFQEKLVLENFNFKNKVEENVKWKDIILCEETKNKIIDYMKAFKKEEKTNKKGLVFTGPPGTGKTYIAKAIANEEKVYFMCPKLSDLKGQFVGQSAPKIKALFEEARLNEPTLIFLDELDTLFPVRDSDDGDSYTKDITNEFLQQLDGVNTGTQKIFVLGATNRIESIDPAVKSRLGNPLEIPLPKDEEIIDHFKVNLKDILSKEFWNNLSPKFIENLKERSEGMSGRDIKDFSQNLKSIIKNSSLKDSNDIYTICFAVAFKGRRNFLIEDLKSKTGLVCLQPKDIAEKKLYGIDKLKEKIEDVVKQIRDQEREKREDFQLDLQNGILLYGPPGNGKSEVVEDIAKKLEMIFIKVESKDIIGYSNKDTLSNLDNIFSQSIQLSKVCDKNEGVILFFDEFDSLAGIDISSTIRGTLLGKLADKRGIRNNNSKLILVGATNFYDQIDDAVKRNGRFDLHLELDNPIKEVACKIINSLLRKENILILEENENDSIYEFYDIIKLKEVNKQIKKFEKMIDVFTLDNNLEKEKIEKRIEQIKEELTVSSSYIKNMIIELKRFIIKTKTFEKGQPLKITKTNILEFKENIE